MPLSRSMNFTSPGIIAFIVHNGRVLIESCKNKIFNKLYICIVNVHAETKILSPVGSNNVNLYLTSLWRFKECQNNCLSLLAFRVRVYYYHLPI